MKNVPNRMADTVNRTPASAPQPAQVVEIQVKRLALVCACCGRGAMAKVYKTDGLNRYMQCEDCGGKYVATYDKKGKPISTVRVRG